MPRTHLLATILMLFPFVAAATDPPRALLVVSSEGRDQGQTRPGFEMDEFAQAWLILKRNGFHVEVASPRGGRVEADKFNPEEAFNAELLADTDATSKLAATLPTASLDPRRYDAVMVIGGKGAMFDLPVDTALQDVLAAVWTQGGVVAAVCHGPAALAEVRLADGSHLVQGRAMTGFTEEEEALFGKRWASEFAFQLEPAMRGRGARWEEAPLMMPKVVVDGRLVTGQNPYSTPATAEAVVRASGRVPVARDRWRDERSMALVEQHLRQRDGHAAAELAAHGADYHAQLIGILGYYQLQAAQSPQVIGDALAIMLLGRPWMDEPQLDVAIAEAHLRLGDTAAARKHLQPVLEKHPQLEQAKALLARMQP
ncbi:DJ-1/PfpI family protein [Stenotrophomonas tumulicola]|uniref:DJ-1/PfpI family protein n=1 Tax=Stenotrophomonas tumulicola TaxID=1685415 RepID=A0A7W3FNM4_9GAMM|nr:DJ-1/PfpI family protein [Stenotrophomonas tumulicola]MBA8682848.1 DJ-1/PfpI family protein [Stenotrophomonas tumulicola]